MDILNQKFFWNECDGVVEDVTLRLRIEDTELRNKIFPTEKKLKMKQTTNPYSFNVTAPDAQINFEAISKDLNSKNPLAFVEVEGNKEWVGYVIVEIGLAAKADVINGTNETGVVEDGTVGDVSIPYVWHLCTKPQDFQKWKKYYQDVKAAPWPSEMVNRATVNVSFSSL